MQKNGSTGGKSKTQIILNEKLTCVPYILHPYIGARRKEKPLNWDEQVADDVRCDGDAHKEHTESLRRKKKRKMSH